MSRMRTASSRRVRISWHHSASDCVELPVAAEAPVADDLYSPVTADEVMGRRELPHSLEGRAGAGHVSVGQVVRDPGRVRAGVNGRVLENGLGLRREAEGLGILLVAEGLLPQAIARQKELAPGGVPDGEGEHAPERIQAADPAFLVEVEDHLRVGVGAEPVAPSHEVGPEVLEIVDLPVEDDPDRAVLVRHRLVAGGAEIDDAETPVREAHRPLAVDPGIVWAAMGLDRIHALQDLALHGASPDRSRACRRCRTCQSPIRPARGSRARGRPPGVAARRGSSLHHHPVVQHQGVHAAAQEGAERVRRRVHDRLALEVERRVQQNGDSGCIPEALDQPVVQRVGLPGARSAAAPCRRRA